MEYRPIYFLVLWYMGTPPPPHPRQGPNKIKINQTPLILEMNSASLLEEKIL